MEPDRQSPTPSQGSEGSDLRSVARSIEGLLDDDGHYNPDGEISRGHPDYDEASDPRAQSPDRQRDERGRFKAAAAEDEGDEPELDDVDPDIEAAGDDPDEDTELEASDTDEDSAESAGDEAQTEDEETEAFESLAQLAEALEVPIDELKDGITHTFNAAGEEVTVTLSELEKGYQKDADYRRSTAKLAQDRQAAEAQFVQRHQAYEAENAVLAGTLQYAEQALAAELNDPRLAELRESDPAEWTARREEIGSRLNGLREFRQRAAQQYRQFTAQQQQALKEREMAALTEKLPEFGKEHKAKAKEVMSEMGFSEFEISNIMDHRLVLGSLELADLRKEVAELRELKAQAAESTKRLKKEIPKLTKPGKSTRRKPVGVRKDNLAKLRARAAKSGNVRDAAKVIEELI